MDHTVPFRAMRIVAATFQHWKVTIYCAAISLAVCFTAFAQTTPSSGINGLGASTMTCVDRDGDGYGTGAGCLGPDADDQDAAVHTGPQAVAKYGTLSAFLAHLGYSPKRIWYVAPNGNDSTCVSGGGPVGIGSPCLTVRAPLVNLAAGDAVIYRAGTYSGSNNIIAPVTNGTSSNPILYMAYPGESALIDMTATGSPGAAIVDSSWMTIDGLKFQGSGSGCIAGGNGSYGKPTNAFHNVTVRHVETNSCHWGLLFGGMDNILIEDSSFHDTNHGGEHGIYVGAKGNGLSSNNTIRRVLAYNNAWSGIHVNGNVANMVVEQTITYGNGISNLSFQNGMHNSVVRNNLTFQGGGVGGSIGGEPIEISKYNGTEGYAGCASEPDNVCKCLPTASVEGLCAHDQTYNLFENNTIYGTQVGRDGTGTGFAGILVSPQTSVCTGPGCLAASLGHNTFRNTIVVAYTNGSNHYAPIVFNRAEDFATSQFENVVSWQSDPAHRDAVVAVGVYPGSYGFTPYTCANWAATFGNITGTCVNADPKFLAADPTGRAAQSSFDFHLQPSSPALNSGSRVGTLTYDLYGNAFASTPSIGAIEQTSTAPKVSPTISITAPTQSSIVSGIVTASASVAASGSLTVTGVQFQVDGTNVGSQVTIGPAYIASLDTTKYSNGLHTLTAIATDSGANTGTASVSFTVNNASAVPTGPTISEVTASSITASAVTISWTTNTASDSQVSYGTTTGYGFTSNVASALTTAHVVTISGLSASTTYHYKVLSRDGQGNAANSADLTFMTGAASVSSSVGWQNLTNTKLKNVCPPNGFNGINYAFADHCGAAVTAWSSAVADTKRNRLIIWGGGHTDYYGNEVYSLNLGVTPPTLTRLTDPSDFTKNPSGCPDANTVDGTPVSRHTYGGIVYLPVQDKMFSFGGGLAPCGGPWSDRTYTLDLSQAVPTWKAMDPINGYKIGYQQTTAVCGYDPNTQTVICNSTGIFFRYDPATNTNTQLSTGQNIPYSASGVIDPKRKRFIFMGTAYQSTTPLVMAVDISPGSSFKVEDWSSQVTGCDALAGANYPGLTYDSVLDRIVGWPNVGNTIYVFNPDQKTCTAQTFANGPTNTLASTTGTFGRFQYFPALNAYGVVSLATLDALKLTLSTSAPVQVPCDITGDGIVDTADITAAISQGLGTAPCGTAALRQPGQCTVVDVQRVINTVVSGAACKMGQ